MFPSALHWIAFAVLALCSCASKPHPLEVRLSELYTKTILMERDILSEKGEARWRTEQLIRGMSFDFWKAYAQLRQGRSRARAEKTLRALIHAHGDSSILRDPNMAAFRTRADDGLINRALMNAPPTGSE